jgi:hypothetical protein
VAIQKKSLISNRTATKKALVAKPEVTGKTGVTRIATSKLKIAAADKLFRVRVR